MIAEMIGSLDLTLAFIRDQVTDLTDEEMILQPAGFPNHAAWTLGHVIYSCQAIAGELGQKSSLPDDWESQFGYGSIPCFRVSERSRKTALLSALDEASQRLRSALLETDENTLADPLPNEGGQEILATKGHLLVQVVVGHTSYHAGQLASWRRAIGRKPVGVFI